MVSDKNVKISMIANFGSKQGHKVEGKMLEYPPMFEDTLLVVTAGGGRAEPDLCR